MFLLSFYCTSSLLSTVMTNYYVCLSLASERNQHCGASYELEARRADSGQGSWGGAVSPLPSARGMRSAVSSLVGSGAKPRPPRGLVHFGFFILQVSSPAVLLCKTVYSA